MFKERLKNTRKSRGLKQQDISDALNINRSTYAGYETGKTKPSFEKLNELADYLEVSTDYLLGRTNDPTPIRNLNADLNSEDPDEELRQLLNDPEMRIAFKDFPSWSDADKQELINYLKAKKLARESTDKM